MKRFFKFLAIILFALTAFVAYRVSGDPLAGLPSLKSGDIVMQTTDTRQTTAIIAATASLYSHTGIVEVKNGKYYVLEASHTVQEIPFADWVKQGWLKRFSVYRHKDMTEEKAHGILAHAKRWIGKSYDFLFLFGNDSYYCSEIPYLAFKSQGLVLGKEQQIKDLYIDNPLVKRIIRQRWKKHPLCQKKDVDFEQCYDIMMKQFLVTPVSLTEGDKVERIFTNYPL